MENNMENKITLMIPYAMTMTIKNKNRYPKINIRVPASF